MWSYFVSIRYLTFPAESKRPFMQLKGFLKTAILNPGQRQHVVFALRLLDLSTWEEGRGWVVARGTFNVSVGASLEDIRLVGAFAL